MGGNWCISCLPSPWDLSNSISLASAWPASGSTYFAPSAFRANVGSFSLARCAANMTSTV